METWVHALRSTRVYGEPALEVHLWLDQYWNLDPNDHTHRVVLHNEGGIEKGVKKFGEWARKHIELHIREDDEGESYRIRNI